MIDRYQLRYFLAVVDQGNFTRAASASHVSQPTLSAGIAKLETAVGSRLFHRNSQRVRLSKAGWQFLSHARRIEREFNLAVSATSLTDEAPLLRLGLLRSLPWTIAADIVAHFRAAEPMAQIELLEGEERDLLAHLSRGRLDFALTLIGSGSDQLQHEVLFKEGYALAIAQTHELASEAIIAAEDMGGFDMILRPHCEALSQVSKHFTARNVRPHFALRTTNDERAMQMVAANLGVTVMPDGFTLPGVVRPKMQGLDLEREIGLVFAPHADAESFVQSALYLAIKAACSAG